MKKSILITGIVVSTIILVGVLVYALRKKKSGENFKKLKATYACMGLPTIDQTEESTYPCGDWINQCKPDNNGKCTNNSGVCKGIDADGNSMTIDCQSAVDCCNAICNGQPDDQGYCYDNN
jgi:hypothetical protein